MSHCILDESEQDVRLLPSMVSHFILDIASDNSTRTEDTFNYEVLEHLWDSTNETIDECFISSSVCHSTDVFVNHNLHGSFSMNSTISHQHFAPDIKEVDNHSLSSLVAHQMTPNPNKLVEIKYMTHSINCPRNPQTGANQDIEMCLDNLQFELETDECVEKKLCEKWEEKG